MDEVETAATAGAGRAEAEAFAVIVSNAFDDSTESGIGHDQLEAYLAGDIHPEGRQWIDAKQAHRGVSVVKGDEDPWIRSQFGTDAEGRPQAVVKFVELLEFPAEEDLVLGEIFRIWSMYKMTVRYDGSWLVVDYEPALASEAEVFTEWTWEGVMDSGEGWRRFSLTE